MKCTYYCTAAVMALSAAVLTACGDTESTATADSSRTTGDVASQPSSAEPGPTTARTEPVSTTAAASRTDVIDGMFDVGGHQLYLHCEGTGSPTIVYLHGSITEPGVQPVSNARRIQDEISNTNRFCAYDRRNVGRSETVDEVQTPDALLSDLRGLLDAAAIEPPYVLLALACVGRANRARQRKWTCPHHPTTPVVAGRPSSRGASRPADARCNRCVDVRDRDQRDRTRIARDETTPRRRRGVVA